MFIASTYKQMAAEFILEFFKLEPHRPVFLPHLDKVIYFSNRNSTNKFLLFPTGLYRSNFTHNGKLVEESFRNSYRILFIKRDDFSMHRPVFRHVRLSCLLFPILQQEFSVNSFAFSNFQSNVLKNFKNSDWKNKWTCLCIGQFSVILS